MGAERPDHLARERLELLASELERTWPDAAASLREGMDDTLTLMRLGDRRAALKDALLDEPVREHGAPRGAM